jgi:hypothetical protein
LEFFRGKGFRAWNSLGVKRFEIEIFHSLEFFKGSGVNGFEPGIRQGYNYEKHVSSTGGVINIKWNSPNSYIM